MVFAKVGEVVTETGKASGVNAVVVGNAGLVVAFAPIGCGLQELAQSAESAATVTDDGLGDGLKLRSRTSTLQLIGTGGDALTDVRDGEVVGELASIPLGPAAYLVRAGLIVVYLVVAQLKVGLM
ncbi:hypothetical protein ACH4GK_42670 [Streptomyces rimosus]|uniref:hypothetical protein n=1 Tax=Streptomyces rimosus TaxID=1927 RepID=UPI00099BBA45|nr:hypothetical protein [Streptomyces rimosus]